MRWRWGGYSQRKRKNSPKRMAGTRNGHGDSSGVAGSSAVTTGGATATVSSLPSPPQRPHLV
jgi:hypothetical protein